MKTTEIAIYSAGGFAREVAWLIESCNQTQDIYKIVCFIDDDEKLHGQTVNDIPVKSLKKAFRDFPSAKVVRAVGDPKTSEMIVKKATDIGYGFETVIHPMVQKSKWVEIGTGSVICTGSILTTNVKIGKFAQINLNCTIGHDSLLEDFATLAPGVHISGWVHLGKNVYVGTGATIINGTSKKPIIIGNNAIVGAGACVTKSIASGATVIGVPAEPLIKTSQDRG